MSGGSYNYLGVRARSGLITVPYTLEDMQERLHKLPYAIRSAWHTTQVISLIGDANRQAEMLADVWHAVEWRDSGDWSEDDMREEIEKYEVGK